MGPPTKLVGRFATVAAAVVAAAAAAVVEVAVAVAVGAAAAAVVGRPSQSVLAGRICGMNLHEAADDRHLIRPVGQKNRHHREKGCRLAGQNNRHDAAIVYCLSGLGVACSVFGR